MRSSSARAGRPRTHRPPGWFWCRRYHPRETWAQLDGKRLECGAVNLLTRHQTQGGSKTILAWNFALETERRGSFSISYIKIRKKSVGSRLVNNFLYLER